mmetsp:Transcript_34427/g.101048  ORF Transcript_34427/g.101048 Transcript_34427/m.101048 type:complete len:149 (+) Transcript_34427:1-447(+)
MGGRRMARLVEALLQLPGDSLSAYAEHAACSSSTGALELAGLRLRLVVRIFLAEGGLLQTARRIAAERGGCDENDIEAADLSAAGARMALPMGEPAAEAVTPDGVAAAAEALAGWLRDARAQRETESAGPRLHFCATCGFALPCPWGC